jgi:hypothetical protein
MQGFVAGAGQASITFIDLGVGISLGRKGIGGSFTYLRYMLF